MATKKKTITERVKTYEDACKVKGISPLQEQQFVFLPEDQRISVFAAHQLLTIAEVLNEGWQPDWSNYNENKYYPWFDLEDYEGDTAGSGFRYYDYVFVLTYTFVGSRLVFKTKELAEYAGRQFTAAYRDWMKK